MRAGSRPAGLASTYVNTEQRKAAAVTHFLMSELDHVNRDMGCPLNVLGKAFAESKPGMLDGIINLIFREIVFVSRRKFSQKTVSIKKKTLNANKHNNLSDNVML